MPNTHKTLLPCAIELNTAPATKVVPTRIFGIIALVSFSAGLVVDTVFRGEDGKRKEQPVQIKEPIFPPAPALSPEQKEINHMLFPETNDLLYHPSIQEQTSGEGTPL